MLYLVTMDEEMDHEAKNWASILAQLAIYFKERVEPYL